MGGKLCEILTPRQIAAFKRAAKTEDRIVLGQIVMMESAAERLVQHGLWERFYEPFPVNRSHSPRYRFTDAGRTALHEVPHE